MGGMLLEVLAEKMPLYAGVCLASSMHHRAATGVHWLNVVLAIGPCSPIAWEAQLGAAATALPAHLTVWFQFALSHQVGLCDLGACPDLPPWSIMVPWRWPPVPGRLR